MIANTLDAVEELLWQAMEREDPEAWLRLGHRRWNRNQRIRTEMKAYLGWIACPRAHAVAHLPYVLQIATMADPTLGVRDVFHARRRYIQGDDPVFALGNLQ